MTTENDTAVERERDQRARDAEIADILDLSSRYGGNDPASGLGAATRRAIREGATLDDFRKIVLDNLPKSSPLAAPAYHPGEPRRGTVMDAVRGMTGLNTRDREFGEMVEESQEFARTIGNAPRGMYVSPERFVSTRTQLAANHPTLLPTDSLSGMFVEELRTLNACLSLGATFLSLGANSYIPAGGGISGGWYLDDEAAPDAVPVTRSIPLTLHRHTSRVKWGYTLAKIGEPHVDELCRREMMREMAHAVDLVSIVGSGTGAMPRGVLNTTGIGLVSMGTNGGPIDWSAVSALQKAVFDEGVTGRAFGYVTNHAVRHELMTTERATGTAKFLIDDQSVDKLAGYALACTSHVPSNLTKGTGDDLSAMIFGNWTDLIIAQFGAIDVVVDPYSDAAKGNVAITLHSAWDTATRHAESFAAVRDIVTA